MTTITEILAEAFNRVKAEHGVTLSRVEFTTGYGALAYIEFSAIGTRPNDAESELVEITRDQLESIRLNILRKDAPKDATYYGSLNDGDFCYWKVQYGCLAYYERDISDWVPYRPLSNSTVSELVEQLTPLRR